MISYSNGRFRSHRPVEEARALIAAEVANLSDEERAALDVLIQELATQQNQEVMDAAERLEWDPDTGPPVPISQWVNDEYYLGETARTLWPKLKEDMIEFFEGDYAECILCLHPDTRVPLLDGTTPTIKELADRWKCNPEPYWVYSYKDGDVVPAKAIEPRKTGVDDYFRVTLEDGTSFIGNARHQMVLRDGRKRMIRDMTPGDSIMPFNAVLSSSSSGDAINGYERIQLLDGSWEYTHRVVARRLCDKCDGDEDTIHHANFNKLDNTPENLEWLRWLDHQRLHAEQWSSWAEANPERAQAVIEILRACNRERWNGPNADENRAHQSAVSRELMSPEKASDMGKVAWTNRSDEAKAAFAELMATRNREMSVVTRTDITVDAIRRCGAKTIKEVADYLGCSANRVRKAIEDAGLTTRNVFGRTYGRGRTNKVDPDNPPGPKLKLTVDTIRAAIDAGSTTTRAAAARLGVSKKTIYNTLKREGLCWADLCELVGNHYVVSVEKIGRGDVYCMTVPSAGNFAVSTHYGKEANPTDRSGVFSSNTGSTRWG